MSPFLAPTSRVLGFEILLPFNRFTGGGKAVMTFTKSGKAAFHCIIVLTGGEIAFTSQRNMSYKYYISYKSAFLIDCSCSLTKCYKKLDIVIHEIRVLFQWGCSLKWGTTTLSEISTSYFWPLEFCSITIKSSLHFYQILLQILPKLPTINTPLGRKGENIQFRYYLISFLSIICNRIWLNLNKYIFFQNLMFK